MTKLNHRITQITSYAPASSANLGVGFDILGLALDKLGDSVKLELRSDQKLFIHNTGYVSPIDPLQNTAGLAIYSMLKALNLSVGLDIYLNKQIPVASGLGGSAASSVAGVFALNQFLVKPLSLEELHEFALNGEELASNARHLDNIAPSLYGGLNLIGPNKNIIPLPYPDLHLIIIHPQIKVETKTARQILNPHISLTQYINQSMNLASAISALYTNNLELLKAALHDEIIEPQRKYLIPGFSQAQRLSLELGAICYTISGSGPSMLCLCVSLDLAKQIAKTLELFYARINLASTIWITKISRQGVRII